MEGRGGLPIDDRAPVLSFDCAWTLLCGILLSHVDPVAEVKEGIADGNNIHFARVEDSPGDQEPDMAKSVPSDCKVQFCYPA